MRVVALAVGDARLCRAARPLGASSVSSVHLHLVDDVAEHRVDAGVDELAEMLQAKALRVGGLAHPDPGDVALAVVLDALGAVQEVVELAFEDGLEVGLHLAAGHVDDDAERQRAAPLDARRCRCRLTVILPSSTSSAGLMRRYSKARVRLPPNSAYMVSLRMRSPSKAEPYDTGIGTLAIFTFMPRTSMQRWMSCSVRSMSSAPRDLVEGHRDDVLVGGHAGRQDLRDARVGDHREAEGDGAGGRRVLQVVDLAEGEHEGKARGTCCRA